MTRCVDEENEEGWRVAWHRGFAPQLSTAGLEALERALATNDPRLIQQATSEPPPLACVADWPVAKACAVGYCGWMGDGLATVREVEEYFAQVCFEADERLGEPAGCRYLLNPFDSWPREKMIALLLPEVRATLASRRQAE